MMKNGNKFERFQDTFAGIATSELTDETLIAAIDGLSEEEKNVCETLNLKSSQVTAKGLTHLSNLPKLRKLNVSYMAHNADTIKAIAALIQLEWLAMSNCRFPLDSLKEFKALFNLLVLELRYCHLSGDIWGFLDDLRHLTRLSICGNPKVSADDIKPHLNNLRELVGLQMIACKDIATVESQQAIARSLLHPIHKASVERNIQALLALFALTPKTMPPPVICRLLDFICPRPLFLMHGYKPSEEAKKNMLAWVEKERDALEKIKADRKAVVLRIDLFGLSKPCPNERENRTRSEGLVFRAPEFL